MCRYVHCNYKVKLGPNITEPPGLTNIRQLRPVTLFTVASTPDMKEEILDEFRKQEASDSQ